MASSKQQKKDKTAGNVEEEGKKYNCQCGESLSSVELNDYNHKAH